MQVFSRRTMCKIVILNDNLRKGCPQQQFPKITKIIRKKNLQKKNKLGNDIQQRLKNDQQLQFPQKICQEDKCNLHCLLGLKLCHTFMN